MKFIERMKKDKGFRFKVVLVVIIAVILYVNVQGDKKEASQDFCDNFNIINELGTTIGSAENFEGCQDASGCAVVLPKQPTTGIGEGIECTLTWIASLIGSGTAGDEGICQNTATGGQYIMSETSPNAICDSGISVNVGSHCGKTVYKCLAADPTEPPQSCNPTEAEIASIMLGLGLDVSCKTAYYMTLFGGAFLILIVFAAI